jgi:undecaprenyl-phosphate 4-deoxy-4-formamido-L-arabinose transferase
MDAVDLSIVVPVYNNRATLPELITRLTATVDAMGSSFELIFVDDASTDGSLDLLLERAERDGRLRVLGLAENSGGQAALCAGFEAVRGRRIVCIDADLENFPEDIPALVAALDRGHDLACGVREQRRDSLTARRLPSELLNAYARRRLKTEVRDLWCGMRAMDSRVVRDLSAEGERCRSLTPLLLRRAHSAVEVPIRHDAAKAGSGYSLLRLTAVAADFFMVTARRPFVALGVYAAVVAAASLLLLFAALLLQKWLLAIACVIVGAGAAVSASLALVGDYVQRLYVLETRPLYRVRDEAHPIAQPASATDAQPTLPVTDRRAEGA